MKVYEDEAFDELEKSLQRKVATGVTDGNKVTIDLDKLKQVLEALESSDTLINGTHTAFGLEGAMDGYYSGCFDVEGNNKLLTEAIITLKEALEDK